ncbi:hypothetical protein [Kineosporia babensis]|uniref:Uncharacterized protein n=1 Tax=Kineosporia babensis TaxID=499548 RepID=A0A9X1SXL5_9ACTN|nr:hypothetical protein [Kineosporia babensis]MCD5316046.1 hypothetical protein [Kineosporia babensis]
MLLKRIIMFGAVVLGLVLAGSVPASAATKARPCVSIKEFGKLKKDLTRAQVQKMTGVDGRRISVYNVAGDYEEEIRRYRACRGKKGSYVLLTYGFTSYPEAADVGVRKLVRAAYDIDFSG